MTPVIGRYAWIEDHARTRRSFAWHRRRNGVAARPMPRAQNTDGEDRRAQRHVRPVPRLGRTARRGLRQASGAGVRAAGLQRRGDLRRSSRNKPDVGAGIARQWFDRDGVAVIIDVPTSSVALAVNQVCVEKNRAYINIGAATTDLTGKQCAPVTIHWTDDNYMLAKSTGGAMVKAGGTTWYFITADYVFGKQLEALTTGFVKEAGGKVLGSSLYPFPGTTDFSLVPRFRPGLRRESAGPRQCRRRHREQHQAGERIRAEKLNENCRAADVHPPTMHGIGLQTGQGLVLTWKSCALAGTWNETAPRLRRPEHRQAQDRGAGSSTPTW